MTWTTEQKVFCVKKYYETKSFKTVQARFRRQFDFHHYPNKSEIFKIVRNFEAYGTVEDRRKAAQSPAGAPITVRTPENVDRVRHSVGRSPSKSLRRRSQQLGISCSSVRCILISDLKLYPYRIQVRHLLTQADKDKRVAMCRWFVQKTDEKEEFLHG